MKTTIEYKSFFAYSESQNKCFYTSFEPNLNLIYGKNTSGKSTLIQAINYIFWN
jgi:AAA15 family ATPase/GTPase